RRDEAQGAAPTTGPRLPPSVRWPARRHRVRVHRRVRTVAGFSTPDLGGSSPMMLVTGATGLVGGFVIEELLRRGRAVRALCRTEASASALAGDVEIAIGSLGDLESLTRATRGVDGIVHAACTVTDSRVDIAAMTALLAGWHGGPFVFISSLDVYGFAGPELITEDTPLSGSYTDYSLGKVTCERLLADAATRAGRTDHVALRAPLIWGPHPNARRRLVNQRLIDHQPII